MITNKCDNCHKEFDALNSPDWFQLSGENGILLIDSLHHVARYNVLDFCCMNCAVEFFTKALEKMKQPTEKV